MNELELIENSLVDLAKDIVVASDRTEEQRKIVGKLRRIGQDYGAENSELAALEHSLNSLLAERRRLLVERTKALKHK